MTAMAGTANAVLSNRYLQAALAAGVVGAALQSGVSALAIGVLALTARAWLDRVAPARTGPGPNAIAETLGESLAALGVDYAGVSTNDRKGLGYAVEPRRLFLVTLNPDGTVAASGHDLDRVREVTGRIESPDHVIVLGTGMSALSATVQARRFNAAAHREAVRRSGITIALADIETPTLRICLDGDETRIRRWVEILTQAREGSLAKPGSRVSA